MTPVTVPSVPISTAQRLSALHHVHLRHGATMVEEAGWQRPRSYGDPAGEATKARAAVGLLDLSPLGKISVKGTALRATLEAAWPGSTAGADARRAVRPGQGGPLIGGLSEQEVLVLTAPVDREATLDRLEQCAAATTTATVDAQVVDVTSGLAGLRVVGPRARDLLRLCTALDVRETQFPNQALAETSLARVHALVVRDDLGGLSAFSIFFDRDYAEFVWDWLFHAGHDLGIVPLGLAAEALLAEGGRP